MRRSSTSFDVTAILLAAGRGSRMGALTDHVPKSLQQVGERPLLIHTLESLQRLGISHAKIVIGYHYQRIINCIESHFPSTFCSYIINPNFSHGSASSLQAAASSLHGNVILIEADILCHQDVFKRMTSVANGLAVARFPHNRVEAKVIVNNGAISKITWGNSDVLSDGDWVGLTKLAPPQSAQLRFSMENGLELGQTGSEFYTSYIEEMVQGGLFQPVDISDLPWIEIDNEDDLQTANEITFPAIAERNQKALFAR